MPRTSTRVQFGLFAIEIRQDSEPSTAEELQPFAKLEDLKSGAFNPQPFASFEPDYWLLDGNFKFLPTDLDEVHVGLVSTQMSDENGDFAVPPVLTVDFSRAHDANGLTLKFSTLTGDYCSSLNIKYYDQEDVLADNDYQPTGTEFTTGLAVEGFNRIVITFYSTSRPYRYLRLSGIDYGELFTFEGEAIKAASVAEESDPLSSELRINTLRLRLYSADAQFNPLDPQGDYAALAERQPLAVYEIVDGNPVFIGQYFLREWKNDSETEIEFEADDLLGLMDQIPCRGGLWSGADLGDLVEAFLGAASIPYELDPSLETVKITGWIPAGGSLRETLQQLAFAAGAQVSCARSWGVRIFPARLASVETPADEITRAQIGARPQLTLRPQIAGVEVTAHKFVTSNTTQELFNDTLAAGEHEILFRQPMHTLSVSGATIVESGPNYAILNVASPGAVTLSGKIYVDTVKVHKITNPSVTGSIKPIVRVKDATLVHAGNVAAVAQRIYDYYLQRLEQKIKLFAPGVEVGECVVVETLFGKQIRAVIEKMSIDLGMGMVARAELAGVEHG